MAFYGVSSSYSMYFMGSLTSSSIHWGVFVPAFFQPMARRFERPMRWLVHAPPILWIVNKYSTKSRMIHDLKWRATLILLSSTPLLRIQATVGTFCVLRNMIYK